MKRSSLRLVSAATAAGIVLFGSAQPAGASAVGKDVDYTFTRGGQQLTCTVHAAASNSYDPGSQRTTLSFTTAVEDDPGCWDATEAVQASATWQRSDAEYPDSVGTYTPTYFQLFDYNLQGVTVTRYAVSHTVYFLCDNPPPRTSCHVDILTQPK